MEKRTIISFIVAGIFIGILAVFQFKTNVVPASRFSVNEIAAKDQLLKEFLDEQAYLKSKIVNLRKNIDDAQSKIEEQTKTTNLSTLEDLKKSLGLTEISGQGIEITLNDSPYVNRDDSDVKEENLIQASDLRDIVNILNAAHSDAISINNQRIVATSPIISVGTSILINNSHIAPPFVVTAAGDKDLIIQRLLNNPLLDSLYERRKKSNIVMEILIKKTLTIPIYNEDLKSTYINLVE